MDEMNKKKLTFHIPHESPLAITETNITKTKSDRFSRSFTRIDWLKMILSASSAIVSGIILGVIILSVFGASKIDGNQIPKSNDVVKQVVAKPLEIYDIKETTFYVLQLGIFSSKDNLKRAQNQYDQLYSTEVPLINKQNGQLFQLYAGVSVSKQDAEVLRSKYSQEGMIPYVKPVILPALQIKTDELKLANQAKFRIESRRLAELLLIAEDHQAIRDTHKKWTATVQILRQHSNSKFSERIVQHFNEAFMAWSEYQKHPHIQHKQVIQRNIMEIILTKDAI